MSHMIVIQMNINREGTKRNGGLLEKEKEKKKDI